MEPMNLPEIINKVLSSRPPEVMGTDDSGRIHASVLIPILKDNGQYKVLLTKRTDRVDAHKGQISFPGGRVDEEDLSFMDAALRETEEEVGIRREDVEVLGRTDDEPTATSNFIVHPFVGRVPYPYEYRISPDEVQRIILAPFTIFLPDSPHAREQDGVLYEGDMFYGQTYRYNGDVIWGATARMMKRLVEIVGTRLATL
ncbi:MAG: CoA pyrophosphatase [Deltaproteobacteria bacterium]|nr:CoA pyrophosphatase [Deltaproteobacteria bacterium]